MALSILDAKESEFMDAPHTFITHVLIASTAPVAALKRLPAAKEPEP